MATSSECTQNTDPMKLIHQGTRQDQRFAVELNPVYAPVDQRKLEHALVFAKTYSKHVKFYGVNNTVTGNWEPFFGNDISAQLAVAAIQDVDYYKSNIKTSFDFLNNRSHDVPAKASELKQHLGYLFSLVGTLAKQLDTLKEMLPPGTPLKEVLKNLIKNQLVPAFEQMIACFKAGQTLSVIDVDAVPDLKIDLLGSPALTFASVLATGLSDDWSKDMGWTTYQSSIQENTGIYGKPLGSIFDKTNHIATHNLFTGIFEQFLKVYARIVVDAGQALQQNLTNRDDHEPHYALFLAFLRLFDYVRAETNTLTARHLDFYYRQILGLKEKPAQPAHVHLLVELAKQSDSHEIAAEALFKAGKDDSGINVYFANDRTFVANKGKVDALLSLYRHTNSVHDSSAFDNGRLFASPIANSDDGLGAKLSSADQSWQPFFNKIYKQGELAEIRMPKAELGFAIASHYLLLAEGDRTVTLDFSITADTALAANPGLLGTNHQSDVICLVTSEQGWFQAKVSDFIIATGNGLQVTIHLDGSAPAITPYSAKAHGYSFDTDLPVLQLKLAHRADADFLYAALETVSIQQIDIHVSASGLKTLALSNDFGPIDASKPFQPFGATPALHSTLAIGSREAFQKQLSTCTVTVAWQSSPAPFKDQVVTIDVEFLEKGQWQSAGIQPFAVGETAFVLTGGLAKAVKPFIDAPDFSVQEPFNTTSRHGYVRLKLTNDFGQRKYEQALVTYIANVIGQVDPTKNPKPTPPVGPFITQLTLAYTATQTLLPGSDKPVDFDTRMGRFFHLAPFGHAEQHAFLKIGAPDTTLYLLPQFKHLNSADKQLPTGHAVNHEAECYIGITDLKPPQNLALFFQVADGTADPLSLKPKPHIHWSYLRNNEWISFAENSVQDGTAELLNSGIITLSIPDDASSSNTLLPAERHWIRAAVAGESDTVCRLLTVAAQGLTATFKNQGNAPDFPAKALPTKTLAAGTITKLDTPDAAVKSINQPFPSFGGRGDEQAGTFYTRISERLRHKDRAIGLWDYEHLLLEAFPQIYQAKCLNHTFYDNEHGSTIYRELAPGHVTIVTVPNQQFHNLRDPLRPYTSLGLLEDIRAYLQKRLSCFVKLHIKNPLFEEVGADFKVRFHDGFDESFYSQKLDDAITRFLSPWAFPGGGNPAFGGKIYRSVLLNFVEEQPYVDYVTDFKVSHTYNKLDSSDLDREVVDSDLSEIEGSKAISILVSARHHTIGVINSTGQTSSVTTCPCASV